MEEGKQYLTRQWLKLLDGSLRLGATVELPVLSDSMLPVFGIGRHIKIQRVPWNACSAGDIIVFSEGRRLTAHRLLFVVRTGRRCYFYQKGDANPLGHFIRAERVVGRVDEYQNETGSYRTLRSGVVRRAGRVEALKQLLLVIWGYTRRLIRKKDYRRMKNNEYRLRVNDRVLGLRFRPARYAALFRDYFDRECSREKPDILLDFKISGRGTEPDIDDSLFTSKTLAKRGFEMSGGLVKGWYDRDSKRGKIRVHEVLTVSPAIRVFEQLLYQAFYSSKHVKPADVFLFHSCGIIHRGAGYLFVGPPESGKSTVARLSLTDLVLNDEVTSVCFSGKGIELCGTPFNGLFKEKSEGCCELKALFLLRKGSEHKLMKAAGAEAVKALMQEIVPPIGLDEVITPAGREEMLDIAIRIRRSVPVYWLEFQPNRGFWDLIDREIKEE